MCARSPMFKSRSPALLLCRRRARVLRQPLADFPAVHEAYVQPRGLHVEAEVDYVALAHYVLLALLTYEARGAQRVHRFVRDVVVVGDNLRADEAALDIAVDLAGCLRSLGAASDRPGTHFFFAGRQKRHETQEIVCRDDELVQAASLDAELRAELLGFFVRKPG